MLMTAEEKKGEKRQQKLYRRENTTRVWSIDNAIHHIFVYMKLWANFEINFMSVEMPPIL